jgi:adenylate cyclase
MDRKFGPGNLAKLLLGKFHHPREEERIFMFLDLKSSTTHAERLGHIRYSQLIQDCFHDLSVVTDQEAEIYQYVGDEAVICWELKKGLDKNNCVQAFFAFDGYLQTRANYYREKYGFVPEFKAGMNVGLVTVAEVGEIKREIAFHGDVLNTAARIQGKCNEFGKRILISEYLHEYLKNDSELKSESLGSAELRGRKGTVGIYSVALQFPS